MSDWKKIKIGELLTRYKEPVDIQDGVIYNRVTIKTKHKGVKIRDQEIGVKIGTKRQWKVKEGQFILSRIDARFGALGMIPKEVDGAIVTNDFLAFDVNENVLKKYLFLQLLKSPIFLEACRKASRGVTQRKRVDEDFLLNYEITIPQIERQEKIVGMIKQSETKCKQLDWKIADQKAFLKELRQQILQEKSVGTVKLKSHVTHLAERVNESTPSHRMIGVSNSDGITDLITNKKEGFEKYKLVEKHSFIYNPMRINVGSIALYEDNATCITSPDYVVFKVSNEYPIKALLFFLKFKQGLQEIAENVQGSVRQRLYFENLCNINIPEFASKDYKVIEDLFSNLDKLEDHINQNKENAEILMQAFLAETFRQ